jgi:hypothetical protein
MCILGTGVNGNLLLNRLLNENQRQLYENESDNYVNIDDDMEGFR